jgi:hypothetical protein
MSSSSSSEAAVGRALRPRVDGGREVLTCVSLSTSARAAASSCELTRERRSANDHLLLGKHHSQRSVTH